MSTIISLIGKNRYHYRSLIILHASYFIVKVKRCKGLTNFPPRKERPSGASIFSAKRLSELQVGGITHQEDN